MKSSFSRALTPFILAFGIGFLPVPAAAQNEAALRAFFEGKSVRVKIDMPGSSDGVDIRADAERALDSQKYGNRLKNYGTAIHRGDAATITLVKLKKDVIEFQLNGGGFGTFGDDTSTSVSLRNVEKSSREKDLEKEIDDEKDSRRRDRMKDELDQLRARRERENRRIDAERARLEELKRQRIAEQRLNGGSRFNLRYDDEVPRGMRPDDVMAALAEYVDFSNGPESRESALRIGSDASPRKGMSRADAEQAFGAPVESSNRREGSLAVARLVFVRGDERITAEFVEDVLIRYTIASR
jgi:hypothetical protein